MALHDTVIFPEGGGQPTDTGLITTTDRKQWEVVQCKRHGGHAIHYVRVNDSTIDAALAAFAPGTSVVAELGAQDFERRYDHVCTGRQLDTGNSRSENCRCPCKLRNIFSQLSLRPV